MRVRLLLLALCAALASASPLTLTFTGVGSGTIGGITFTNDAFTFTYVTDTSDLFQPPYPGTTTDWTTPDILATFTLDMPNDTVLMATLSDTGVFVHPGSEERLGIWLESEDTDWLTITDPAFYSYNLQSDLTVDALPGEITVLDVPPGDAPSLVTSMGSLTLDSVSSLDFNATVGSASAPEPSSASLLVLGGAMLIAGTIRRRRRT